MSEWKEYKLGDLAKIKGGKRLPKGKNLTEIPNKHPYIRTRDIDNHKIKVNELLYVPDDVFTSVSRYIVEKGDVIISIVGSIGFCAIIPKELHLASLTENCAKIVNVNKILDKVFLYYYLISEVGQEEIEKRNVGAVQPKLPLYNIQDIPLNLPPLSEQIAIAAILSSLDDKIDLLHRQNKTLEAMAETLFRQWFIEEADDSWEEKIITELFEVRDGTHDSPKQTVIGKPLLTSRHILDHKLDYKNAYLISDEDFANVNKRSKVETNDILFSMIGTIGLIYLEKSKYINYAIKNIGLFKTSQNPKWTYFTYSWLKSDLGQDFIFQNRSGSTQEYISLGGLRSIVFYYRDEKQVEEFNAKVHKLFEKVYLNQMQIQTLEKLRDTLLPKLMSGEVRVKMDKN